MIQFQEHGGTDFTSVKHLDFPGGAHKLQQLGDSKDIQSCVQGGDLWQLWNAQLLELQSQQAVEEQALISLGITKLLSEDLTCIKSLPKMESLTFCRLL